ncbi:Uncharacterised protein [Bordetella pertussis]|nr:Uncharacterised protein [Bordetella pertussis]CFW38427.1 Uncharacterised protein [Bordetella pertussis]
MDMLSVFITPWQKPTACQSAIRSAVRRVTAASRPRISPCSPSSRPAPATRHSG